MHVSKENSFSRHQGKSEHYQLLPQERFFEFDAVKWLLRLFWPNLGAQNITTNSYFTPGLVTGF